MDKAKTEQIQNSNNINQPLELYQSLYGISALSSQKLAPIEKKAAKLIEETSKNRNIT